MRTFFDIIKVLFLCGLTAMLFSCDNHLKEKYDSPEHDVRETRMAPDR